MREVFMCFFYFFLLLILFFFNDTATTEIYTLSLHDALPISLSLAAALTTLKKLEREPVTATLYAQGEKIITELRTRIEKEGAEDFLSVTGNPTWSFFLISDVGTNSQWQIKTLFLQEMFARGILTIGTHNMSFSHTDADLDQLFNAYNEVIPMLVEGVRHNKLESMLRCQPLQPLFKVR